MSTGHPKKTRMSHPILQGGEMSPMGMQLWVCTAHGMDKLIYKTHMILDPSNRQTNIKIIPRLVNTLGYLLEANIKLQTPDCTGTPQVKTNQKDELTVQNY